MQRTYDHLKADFELRPRQIAAHLRQAHGVEPKAAKKGYEREVWHRQHERAHSDDVYLGRPGHIGDA